MQDFCKLYKYDDLGQVLICTNRDHVLEVRFHPELVDPDAAAVVAIIGEFSSAEVAQQALGAITYENAHAFVKQLVTETNTALDEEEKKQCLN
jgi:hypothetical protein